MSPYVNDSNRSSLSEHRHCQESARATTLLSELTVGKLVCCFRRREIMEMNRLPPDYSSAHNIAWAHSWSIHTARRNLPIMGYKRHHVTIKAADNSVVCLTEPCGTLSHHIQYRLNIRRRTCNHTKDLARRGLLLQRLREFLE